VVVDDLPGNKYNDNEDDYLVMAFTGVGVRYVNHLLAL
jgi:hypothetical protein